MFFGIVLEHFIGLGCFIGNPDKKNAGYV